MRSDRPVVEWPTVILLVATYLIWAVGTTWAAGLSLPVGILVTAIAIAQFSSLQHEVLHGHPFRNRLLNEALVFPALTVVVPYGRFRDLHLAHHHDPILTDPYDDPESNFADPAVWAGMSAARRGLHQMNNTLLGRMVLGPAISTVSLISGDMAAIRAGNRDALRAWVLHIPGLMMVLFWLVKFAEMPVWAYLIAAYAGFGLLKIRTFLEHRAHDIARARTVIIEDRGPLALLFLNNNLHAVHHMHPQVAWYRLPSTYRANRDHYLRRNDGYLYRSYAEIFRRFLFSAKDPVPHPLWSATTRATRPDAPAGPGVPAE